MLLSLDYPPTAPQRARAKSRTRLEPLSLLAAGSLLLASGSFATLAAAPAAPQGVITAKIFLNIGGTGIADLTNNAAFPNSPSEIRYEPYFELWAGGDINTAAPADVQSNFGAQLAGYFYPATSGQYTFYLSADDNARLYLSTDDDPANKKLIATEPQWNNPRDFTGTDRRNVNAPENTSATFTGTQWPTGNTITLQAGRAYYIEALVKEGGGGDNLSVSIDGVLPIPGDRLASIDKNSGPPTVTTQPQSVTVLENQSATFSVVADGTPPYSYQWTKNGSDIAGADSATYTLSRATKTDNGAVFAVKIQGAAGNVTSAGATLTVTSDTAAPGLVSATPTETFDAVVVVYSEAVNATAEQAANYKADGGLTITGVSRISDTTVRLATSKQGVGATYTLTINGVQDIAAAPNTIAANTTATFQSFVFVNGVALHKFWDNITQNNIAGLTNNSRFPDSPTFITLEPLFEYGPDGSNESGSNYGNQLIAWITPPQTGNYVFFASGDDPVNVFLSTDDNPANKKLIAVEPQWNNARDWQVTDRRNGENRSDTYVDTEWPAGNVITLTAGKRYYLEALHTEGGGGDSVGVAWQLPGAAEPANGDPPIGGQFMGVFLNPNGASVTIDQQPVSVTLLQNRAATFDITATGTSAYGNTVAFQWQKAAGGSATFSDIAGATSASFTTPLLALTENGAQYRVIASVPTLSATSSVATVTVLADTVAPKISKVAATGPDTLSVTFDETLDKTTAESAANYSLGAGPNVTGAVLGGSGTNIVLLSLGSALTSGAQYTLTVNAVKDLFNNTAANVQLAFTANIITYADIILADGPIAFYRFEETGGSVAKNSGSNGGDGVYYTGDEAAPREGGTPSTAKGDPGPRPPLFLGFGSNNRAATFGGPDTQDWVDTKNQFLSHLSAFSLEYWVKPEGRADFPNRIGIVGQNDDIEYGFITPNTIQIWTPSGGSLNTAYSFPDNEWHHVATIADGRTIKTYYDGKLIGTGGSATSDYGPIATYNVHIGGGGVFDSTGNFFKGQIDEVAIFDKAIPAARLAAHFKAGKEGGVIEEKELKFTKITLSGTQITIQWDGTGTLEEAQTVSGPWSVSANQNNPQTVTASGTKFLRLRR